MGFYGDFFEDLTIKVGVHYTNFINHKLILVPK
jgi:hypothetical protein